MTTGQLITIVISIVGSVMALVGVLLTVRKSVRDDASKTGALEAEVKLFAKQLETAEEARAEERKLADARTAEALARSDANRAVNLRVSEENLRRMMDDTVTAVRGYQTTVDELKTEMTYVRNMWAGERRLVTELQALREEIIRNRDERREQLRLMGLDIERLKVEHKLNHPPRVSGSIVTGAELVEEGAPSEDWGAEGCKR